MRGLPPQRPSLNGGNRITESALSMHGFMAFRVAFEDRCVWGAGCRQGRDGGVLAGCIPDAGMRTEVWNSGIGFICLLYF